MNRSIVGIVLCTIAGLACSSPTSPVRDIALTVDQQTVVVASRTVRLDVTVRNESSNAVKPYLCGNVKLKLVKSTGSVTDITAPLQCGPSTEGPDFIQPSSEVVLPVQVTAAIDLDRDATYRISLPLFIQGSSGIKMVTSSDFRL
jgi:hypothetical protein